MPLTNQCWNATTRTGPPPLYFIPEHDDDFCPDGGDSSSGSSSGTDSDFDPSSPLPQPKKGRAKAAKGGAAAKSGPQSSGRRAEVKAASVVKPPASKGTGKLKRCSENKNSSTCWCLCESSLVPRPCRKRERG